MGIVTRESIVSGVTDLSNVSDESPIRLLVDPSVMSPAGASLASTSCAAPAQPSGPASSGSQSSGSSTGYRGNFQPNAAGTNCAEDELESAGPISNTVSIGSPPPAIRSGLVAIFFAVPPSIPTKDLRLGWKVVDKAGFDVNATSKQWSASIPLTGHTKVTIPSPS